LNIVSVKYEHSFKIIDIYFYINRGCLSIEKEQNLRVWVTIRISHNINTRVLKRNNIGCLLV
jgi:hypothetical protein